MASKKSRVEFRKNRTQPPRVNDVTRQFDDDASAIEDAVQSERVRAKGDLSRHRTIREQVEKGETTVGRVLRIYGLYSDVELADAQIIRCTVRRVLKSMQIDSRATVTTGDQVRIRLDPAALTEGVIVQVEPRHGILTRSSRRREHVLVANVDQVVIVVSLAEPALKPHLIDRYIAAAEQGGLAPIVCLNKCDLTQPALWQSLVGSYWQIGIPAFLTSAQTGRGIDLLRKRLIDRTTVFAGQSGVGKSSLLNAIEPGLDRRVREISDVNQKGRHTTTTAELIRLHVGGWVVDTPGVRQVQLWDTRPEEVEGYFREFRPYIALCRFPDCTHTHEKDCAVLQAVDRKEISERRYLSYAGLVQGLEE